MRIPSQLAQSAAQTAVLAACVSSLLVGQPAPALAAPTLNEAIVEVSESSYPVLKALKAERQIIVDAIETARAHGDLSENAEYHAAKERQGQVEATIGDLEDKLSRAQVIDPKTLSGDKAVWVQRWNGSPLMKGAGVPGTPISSRILPSVVHL